MDLRKKQDTGACKLPLKESQWWWWKSPCTANHKRFIGIPEKLIVIVKVMEVCRRKAIRSKSFSLQQCLYWLQFCCGIFCQTRILSKIFRSLEATIVIFENRWFPYIHFEFKKTLQVLLVKYKWIRCSKRYSIF